MTSIAEVQALLRFLSQDAKIPVPLAMSKIKDLKELSLISPETLSQTPLPKLQSIFHDEKLAKQVLSAAKRVSKKRSSPSDTTATSSSTKRSKIAPPNPDEQLSPSDFEASLALPTVNNLYPTTLEDDIKSTALQTNRAPLVVAFVVQLLKYTMPSQPLSSRLSLAQAVMSIGAQSKALHLGIQSGKAAQDEGWGEGQPKVKVMGRELRVMRRWGYEWQDHNDEGERPTAQLEQQPIKQEFEAPSDSNAVPTDLESQETIKGDPSPPPPSPSERKPLQPPPQTTNKDTEPPLWALNLETLRSTSNTSPLLSLTATNGTDATSANLPIHSPHAARTYLLKSFASAPSSTTNNALPSSPHSKTKKATASKEKEEKEHNLALLLHALDLLYSSWINVIGAEELDRRAWGWYVRVRPEVESGPRGWGGRGEVRLGGILELRR